VGLGELCRKLQKSVYLQAQEENRNDPKMRMMKGKNRSIDGFKILDRQRPVIDHLEKIE
jgi:hypothetical protein